MISMSDKSTKLRLERMGYVIKRTEVGYWVDGAYGYLVAGYYRTEAEAISCAANAIQQARASDRRPVWMFEQN